MLNISAAAISNYSFNIFLLKGVLSLLLLLTVGIFYKTQNTELRTKNFKRGLVKISFILFLFIGYLAITLTYSPDANYGFQKILNFIISVVPSILTTYYLLLTSNNKRIKIFINSLIVISVITVIYIIIDYPFDPGSIYEYRAGRWSHVIYGRMIGSIAVVLLLYLFWMIEKSEKLEARSEKKETFWKISFIIFFTSISVYGLYLSSLRSAMLGLVVVRCS